MVSSWSYKLSLCRGKKGRKGKAVISSPIVKASRKWRRVASPLNDKQTNVGTPKQLTTPKKITFSPLVNRPKSQSKRKLFQSPGKLQEKQLKLDSDFSVAEDPSFWSVDVDEDYEEYSLAMEKMPERRRAIQTFFKLLNENSFPLNNVAFHLFCDAVEFYENKGNQCIRYSDRSKTFWWTGKKLFHGKFLRFMGGLKETDNINFAIPDNRVLRDFNPFDVKIPSKLNPGFQEQLANIGKKAFEGASCILSVDGKKITPGLSTDFGDIDLLGFESRSSLQERRNEHASDLNEINEFQTYVERLVDHDVEVWYGGLKTRLQKVECIIFRHLRQLRESMKNATIACETFKTKAGSDWKTSQLQFVINSYETLKIRIDICLKELMDANERICHQLAIMNGTDHLFAHDSYVDVAYQRNLHELKEPSEIHDLTPKYTKQRSEQWFELRKCVKLTGSTIHNGLGLDGLKKQKEHFKQQFCSTEHIFNDAQTAAMKWGKDNEANAMATLASVVAPVLFPNKLLCEEGAYFIESEDGTRIIEVSPDGSLKSEPEGQAEYGIEIKCPVPGKIYSTDVHYALPSRYFCQCLAEMAALMPISEKLIYLCWTPESTTVFEISNSENVWSKIEAETKAVYYKQNPSIPTRISQTAKSIKADLSDLHSSVQFLGEFPSKKAFETGDTERPRPDSRLLYHKEPMQKPRSSCVVTIKELKNITEIVKPAISKSFNLRRNKASEVVIYILVDTDRLSKPDSIPLVPVAYFFTWIQLK